MVAQIDSDYRSHGLRKTLRRFISYMFFEGRPHTTKGQWFNPVVFSLLRGLQLLPGNPELYRPIFITGLGRSGTTVLGVLLSLHRDIGFLNEPKAIWKTADPRHDVNGDYTHSHGFFRLGSANVTTESKQSLNRIFSRYLKLVHATRLVDKYPELIFRVDYLLHAFDNPRVIFISRCGVDAVHSIDLWSKRLAIKRNDRIDDWWGRDDIKWHYLQQQILQTDPEYESVKDCATDNLDHVNRAALEWVVTMREGFRYLKKHPDNIHHIVYEKLLESPEQELSAIFEFCGLSEDSSVLKYAATKLYKNTSKPWPNLLPPIEKLFTETMKQFDYDPEKYKRK